MPTDVILAPTRPARLAEWKRDMAAAFASVAIILLIHVISGLPTLQDMKGDNDSLMRLVQVRDLVAGQGWFDLHQYRMGLPGGFEMHWSRFVDVPIAAIVVVVATLTGSMAAGENAALILWPMLLLFAALFFLLRAMRAIGGEPAMLPGLMIGAATLYFGGLFAPGSIDHHNVQLVLSLAMLAALLGGDDGRHGAALAGACAALMLAIGMETLPYVAAAGAFVACAFVVGGDVERRTALRFGLAFALVCAAAFFSTVSRQAWGTARCDALSVAQLAVAAVSGGGLAAIAAAPLVGGGWTRRLAALAVLAAAIVAVAVVFFPQCLAEPFADLDPRLKAHWMGSITETRPLWSFFEDKPETVFGYYVTPLLGLILACLGLGRGGVRRAPLLVGLFLLTAVLVSMWQVRGAMFSIPFATIPLAAWVGTWRRRAAKSGAAWDNLRVAAAWLLSVNVTWGLAADYGSTLLDAEAAPGMADKPGNCQAAGDYAALAALPAGDVLAVANLGAPILRYTPHRVLAGLYHRNIEGNLVALSAFSEPAAAAEALIRRHGLGYVAICPGDGESKMLAKDAPTSFIAAMLRGEVPDWLEPVSGTADAPLRIFRVLPRGHAGPPKPVAGAS